MGERERKGWREREEGRRERDGGMGKERRVRRKERGRKPHCDLLKHPEQAY